MFISNTSSMDDITEYDTGNEIIP